MRRLWLVFVLSACTLCSAQITGVFSLEKTSFAPGEPVVLSFTLHNEGKDPQAVETADPYNFCSGYRIHMTRDDVQEPACFQGFLGSCVSITILLAPGASRTERILLNYRNENQGDPASINLPGSYTVDATRQIVYGTPTETVLSVSGDQSEVHEQLHIRVDDALQLAPAVYAPWVQQLTSKDDGSRSEAARTLATLAPPVLEPLLLSFATSNDWSLKQFAPLALTNLATKASLAVLAHMLLSEPGTYQFTKAADGLGKTYDSAWFPLLLAVADKYGDNYLADAAESGGEAAVPALLSRLRSPKAETRSAAIYALGATGSRAAVPILISLLGVDANHQNRDGMDMARQASAALTQLTHLSAEPGANNELIPGWRNRWQRWWLTDGATAPIYRPTDCASNSELP